MRRMVLSKPTKIASPIEKMADIELGHRRDGRDGRHRIVGQAVAGMAFQADRRRMGRGGDQSFELALALRSPPPRNRRRYGARPPGRRASAPHRAGARSASMNSETRMPASTSRRTRGFELVVAARARRARLRWCAPRASPAPGRRHAGLCLQRDRQHLLGRRHLQIERQVDLAAEALDVAIRDMAAILAQMRGDAVGAGLGGEPCGAHRIGMAAAARIADGRDMVDVHAEPQACGLHSCGSFRSLISLCSNLRR